MPISILTLIIGVVGSTILGYLLLQDIAGGQKYVCNPLVLCITITFIIIVMLVYIVMTSIEGGGLASLPRRLFGSDINIALAICFAIIIVIVEAIISLISSFFGLILGVQIKDSVLIKKEKKK